ncbi:MAG: Phenylalanine-tRNA ligase beta subunit [Candidatus Falkowbacteria bacterium GW2011_GWC2_38_22]|uniref:Phenylalanine--tRNA ligase beta subunit n=1 Tax=Candidatus Falkowbacteria bacterium GW2011_GWE1_38_31 TaxID=1618638 RepID=A0A0G0JXB8_9BACT|nr:MAG: Phenylalanine-tRNA ligase beta subunit [Candidatus Falkowbacteria bacterium GW2011_GWF2_38_1205]KKQ61803.1 MAG: Phenylalanine-tRNA ligase beta subunit [Candidatus Falkowbacteria bacterium GW2011_GWC2_38_22]KKQ64111.1 MAG: Phenylalanine-tRNA ligase beta subunit [Candidatus Falkowbacteria bacterium GW2011_GWF1_38_22]KKQ66539.1 MAG: Phenylalanine-tRNA ligase beta subunit [Candidatus Falkowbacteria bacterium GW2011_GWE2_38_254]KKQ71217.1 MAG: Phenylalanine-tRNA ligase beta subunit [Candidat
MYLSLNWLKDYIDLPKSITPDELGNRLTLSTVEIDSVEKQEEKFKNIMVGKILEVKAHPNAERLRLARVDIGAKEEWIVCGAPNIEAGQMVPVALVGAVLPSGVEIKQAEIRGIKSCGMLCAPDEIGLGEDHNGIMILEKGAKVGQKLAEYLKIDDVLFEVDNKSITNRPDLWGHIGMARDINAFLEIKPKKTMTDILAGKKEDIVLEDETVKIDVKVDNFELCPRYMAVALGNIKIAPSPAWMAERLIAVGVRPINNIVDATNYIMLDLGQPLHAFDFENIASVKKENGGEGKILVRTAKADEEIVTLDGQTRKLDKEMLVITDSEKPVAIAGVMGGANSEISNDTKTIVIESANFNFISIRKTSTKLGLRSEASQRYEKSLDPNLCETSLVRAVNLIKEICPGARVVSQVVDEEKYALNQGPIEIELDWLNKIIGEDIGEKKISGILSRLGFGVEILEAEKKILKITIPTWRATKDISLKEDIVEEVARIFGYDNLLPRMPKVAMHAPEINKNRKLERELKKILAEDFACEVSNYSYVGDEQLKKLGIDYGKHIRLANPIANYHTMLRQSLAPNLLSSVIANQARQESFTLFEIGNIYINIPSGPNKNNTSEEKLPFQEKRLGISVAGSDILEEYNQMKSLVGNLFAHFYLEAEYSGMAGDLNWIEESMATQILIFGEQVGTIYAVNQKTKNKIGLKKQVVIAEIGINKLLDLINKAGELKFKEFEKFPKLIRDLAFVVNEKVLYNDIRKEILSFHEIIKEVELFDVYQGDKVGAGNKSLAFHIAYQADKTLTGEEADAIQTDLIKKLEERFEAKVRDY